MVKAQYGAAQAQVKINDAATGISREMTEMNMAMQRAQDRLLQPLAKSERELFMAMLVRLVETNNQYGRSLLRE